MSALTPKKFISQIQDVGEFCIDVPNEWIKNEPMFFNSDLNFARNYGGPITRQFIESLPYDWRMANVVFDSRVHMLMPGWYPAIPGWHHDDVPRGADGQPDYENPSYSAQHIMGLVNAEVCPTSFALGCCKMPLVPEGEIIYKVWHDQVQRLVDKGDMSHFIAQDRRLYYFDCDTFHTGTKAVSNGWRWFGRVSRHTDRALSITNEIRQQVQVYLEFPTEGW